MNVIRHRVFKKHFKARILPNPKNPVLHDHRLAGKMKTLRAFSVTGDIRMVYQLEGESLYLYDVGSHNQVY